MIKNKYLKELFISAIQQKGGYSNTAKDVMKIQSWLNLYAMEHPASGTSTVIDGDFGPATEAAVKNFQKDKNIPQTGIVDCTVFGLLSQPVKNAFTINADGEDMRTVAVNIALQHLNNAPFELTINGQSNSGPWVRSYMDDQEGTRESWCMGFVQTILDQAASQLDKEFSTLMPLSYSCTAVAKAGLRSGLLNRYNVVRNNPSIVKPGDVFFIQKSDNSWTHTGLITAVQGDLFYTIEGNTNTDGSSNGNGVYRRARNFRGTTKMDVFSIEPLV